MSAEDSSLEYLRTLGEGAQAERNRWKQSIYSILVDYSIDSILYDDSLTCSLTNNTEIGSFEVKLSRTNYGNIPDCIQVIANRFLRCLPMTRSHMMVLFDSSQATVDDVLCGTTVRAVVTRELVTVQQEHTEYVKVNRFPTQTERERSLFDAFLVAESNHTDRWFHFRIERLRDYHHQWRRQSPYPSDSMRT